MNWRLISPRPGSHYGFRLMSTPLISITIAGMMCSPKAAPTPNLDELLSVSIKLELTPGKPNAPTETVEVARKESKDVVTVVRAQVGEPPVQDTAAIDTATVERIWHIVVHNHLSTFQPDTSREPSVADFGQRRLIISFEKRGSTESVVHEVSWTAPPANNSAIEPLFKELGALAKTTSQAVRLYYF